MDSFICVHCFISVCQSARTLVDSDTRQVSLSAQIRGIATGSDREDPGGSEAPAVRALTAPQEEPLAIEYQYVASNEEMGEDSPEEAEATSPSTSGCCPSGGN